MTSINVVLILVALVLGVLNALLSGRAARAIAGGFARIARRREESLAALSGPLSCPPSSHRLQHSH